MSRKHETKSESKLYGHRLQIGASGGRKLKSLSIIYLFVLGFVIAMLSTILNGDYSNARRSIYFRHKSKFTPAYLFGYLPTRFNKCFTEEIVEETTNYELINITYDKMPFKGYNYILLKSKTNPQFEEILLDSDSMYWQIDGNLNWLSSQLNIDFFNAYIALNNVCSENEVIDIFLKFLSGFGEMKYTIISDINEFNEFKIKDGHYGLWDINYENNFTPDFNVYVYCLFSDIGLFEIDYVFNEGQLLSIKDRNIFLYSRR